MMTTVQTLYEQGNTAQPNENRLTRNLTNEIPRVHAKTMELRSPVCGAGHRRLRDDECWRDVPERAGLRRFGRSYRARRFDRTRLRRRPARGRPQRGRVLWQGWAAYDIANRSGQSPFQERVG